MLQWKAETSSFTISIPFSNERLLKRIQRRVRAFGFHRGVCVLKQITTTTTTENS